MRREKMSIFDIAKKVKFGGGGMSNKAPRIEDSTPRGSSGTASFKGSNVAGNAPNIWKNVKRFLNIL